MVVFVVQKTEQDVLRPHLRRCERRRLLACTHQCVIHPRRDRHFYAHRQSLLTWKNRRERRQQSLLQRLGGAPGWTGTCHNRGHDMKDAQQQMHVLYARAPALASELSRDEKNHPLFLSKPLEHRGSSSRK